MNRLLSAAFAAVVLASCTATPAPSAAAPQTASPTASPAESPSQTPAPKPTPSATPFSAPSDAAAPAPLPSSAAAEPTETPGPTPPPGTTPFPTPGPTITPGSTRVIGTITHGDGSPAAGVCVVLEVGICPIGTDDQGVWFTDIPAGPIRWNFIYKVDGVENGRQFILSSSGGELRLPVFRLPD